MQYTYAIEDIIIPEDNAKYDKKEQGKGQHFSTILNIHIIKTKDRLLFLLQSVHYRL